MSASPSKPEPGEVYQHFRNRHFYLVVRVGLSTHRSAVGAGRCFDVTYDRIGPASDPDDPGSYTRPLEEWFEEVGGAPRFSLVPQNDPYYPCSRCGHGGGRSHLRSDGQLGGCAAYIRSADSETGGHTCPCAAFVVPVPFFF